jgi:CDP-glucose 4,6-dehydratase
MGGRDGALEGMGLNTSFWLDRPVFISGGSGLVGSWLVKRLVQAGAQVVCLLRDRVPQSELVRSRLIEKVTVVRGDVRDEALLERILGEYEIDTVIHLAAQAIVSIANRNPLSTFETNVGGTWSLLEACRRSPRVKQVVIASSDKAYGENLELPYHEETPLNAQHPYDVSKACADRIARSYAACFDLPVAITRCGNFFGGGDLNWNRIIPGTIRSILRGQRPVIRSDGNFTRDYFYVEDGVSAYLLLAEQLALRPDLKGQAFNFSNETPISVIDLVNFILSLTHSTLQPDIQNHASHEIRDQFLSAAKARQELGWQPSFDLEQGLLKTIAWYAEFFHDERKN